MKKIFLCLLLLGPGLFSVAQTSFNKLLGGNNEDNAQSIQQTTDGGYIIAGWSYTSNNGDLNGLANNGSADAYIVKLNPAGAVEWQKLFGGTDEDKAITIKQTQDGVYVVAGFSFSSNTGTLTGTTSNGNADYWVFKLDANGNLLWQKLYGGTGFDVAVSLCPTSDGGCVVAGTIQSITGSGTFSGLDTYSVPSAWLLKLDGSGNIQWQKIAGGDGRDWAMCVQQTTDGGYIMAGYTDSHNNYGTLTGVTPHGNYDYWLLKLDNAGNTLWQALYGGPGDDQARSVQQTADGGYIVTGASSSSYYGTLNGLTSNGANDYWTLKLNSTGGIEWQKLLGGTADEYSFSVQQTTNGGYLIAGYSASSNTGTLTGLTSHGGNDYWIVQLGANGNLLWQRLLGGSSSDIPYSITQTSDGSYAIAGISLSSNSGSLAGVTNHGGFFDWWISKNSLSNSVLPVSLTGFGVQCVPDKSVRISWSTSQELNSAYFEVQKSSDGVDWTTVGRVNGYGNSGSPKNYQATDFQGGPAQYRLKQVDRNGDVAYSNVVQSACETSNNEPVLYPTPANNNITLAVISPMAETVTFEVFNTNGTLVMRVPAKVQKGTNNIALDVHSLAAGQYVILGRSTATHLKKVFSVIR